MLISIHGLISRIGQVLCKPASSARTAFALEQLGGPQGAADLRVETFDEVGRRGRRLLLLIPVAEVAKLLQACRLPQGDTASQLVES